jgi:hypothetical protein
MAGQVEGWDIGENETAAWARNPERTIDLTIAGGEVGVDVECHDGGPHTALATIPLAVLREVLRRVDTKGAK